jgi:tRNA A-37 threonylcarbamoyl transferase component Bud32/tetratricopeptide (TPR) repeat protein
MAETTEKDLSGVRFGDYQLLRRLGKGAMAEVYLAEQLSLKRRVAFKVLRGNLASDETYVARFTREAQAAASLVDAHIVQIYEVGCIAGVHFIAQEYVPGHNLHQVLSRCGSPDVAVALSIMRQTADGLRKASEQGIVHRDIKPENIMLAENGEVKIADFGLARLRSDEASSNLTQAGFTMGTPLYMSPEQVEGRQLDPRSDIYALGVTCYEMLAGQTPFRGETALSVAVQHLQNQAVPLETVRPDLPLDLCRAVHKMLAKNPNDRYQTARLLLKDLRALSPSIGAEEELALVEQWAAQGGPGLPSRHASTVRLSTLMQTARRPAVQPRSLTLFGLGLIAVFVLGLGAARITRPKPLLSDATVKVTRVERKASAEAQYVYALMVDTEVAWRSVVDYFPDQPYFVRRAEQQLARTYLQQDDYPRALTLFEKFADMDDTETEFRAFGLAGAAAVYSYQGKPDEAAKKLAELWPLKQHLDQQTKNWIVALVNKNTRKRHDTALQQWDQWLRPKGKSG